MSDLTSNQDFVPMTADRFVDELCTIQYISPQLREVIKARIETLELRLAGSDALLEGALQRLAEPPSPCRWTFDESDGGWYTRCGEAHLFTIDGPKENGHKFCPYCGGAISLAETKSAVREFKRGDRVQDKRGRKGVIESIAGPGYVTVRWWHGMVSTVDSDALTSRECEQSDRPPDETSAVRSFDARVMCESHIYSGPFCMVCGHRRDWWTP